MEDLKTLDEGFMISKMGQAQNPCDKTLEEASGLSGLSEKCSGLVSASGVLVGENGGGFDANTKGIKMGNVEVVNQVLDIEEGIEGVESGAEESQTKGGSLESDFGGKGLIVPHTSGIKNGDVSVQEVSSAINENQEIVMEEGMKEGNESQLNGVESAGKIEVSGNISLFVEVFGPLNGIVQSDEANSGEHVLRACSFDRENVCKGNRALLSDNGENPSANVSEVHECVLGVTKNDAIDGEAKGGYEVGEETISNQECKFSVGDFVWVKTKTQSWWPGMVYDPSDASKDSAKSDQRDCLLVRYFGIGSFVWCSPSQLKPFIENFEQMSRQSNSRSFLGALEKATGEIGRRVKLEMTCSCILKECRTTLAAQLAGNAGTKEGDSVPMDKTCELGNAGTEGDSVPMDKTCELGGNLVIQFEPPNFLAFLKYLAQDVSIPGMLELTVIQNHLSAFYRAIGHRQLPIHQLHGTTDAKDGAGDRLAAKSRSVGQIGVQVPGTTDLNSLNVPIDDGFGKSCPKSSGKQSGVSVDSALEKEDEDLTKLSGGDRDVVLEKCGSDVAGINSGEPALESWNRPMSKDSEVRNGSDEVVDLHVHKLTSPFAEEMTSLSISLTTESKAFSVGNGDEGIEGKSEKAYESRERKKSKYLSPPYVKLSWGRKSSPISEEHETENCKEVSQVGMGKNSASGQSMGSPPIVKCSGKKLQKKWSRKTMSGHSTSYKLEGINASSAELLSELHLAALDCLYPNENRDFDSIERFFSGFRRLAFRDESYLEMNNKQTVGQECNHGIALLETLPGIDLLETLPGVEVQMEKGKRMEEALPDVKHKRRGRKKKEETILGLKTKPTPVLSGMNDNVTTSGSVVIDFQEIGHLAMLKKRKKKAGEQTKAMVGLPDLNGNCNAPTSDSKVMSPVAPQDKPELKKRKRKDGAASVRSDVSENNTSSMLKDVQVTGLYSLKGIAELNNIEGIEVAGSFSLNTHMARQLGVDGNTAECSSLVKDLGQMDLISPGGKLKPKKRKREEKASFDSLNTNVTSAIPDLNGNAIEPSSLGKDLAEMNCIPAGGKPQRKRRKRNKPTAGIPDINVKTNGEALGTALLLKFASGFPMPPKEALVATFSGFGPLKESETQILNDSGSAQVIFIKSSDARDAFRSLEKNSPFGPALVNYRLQHLSAPSRALESNGNVHMPPGFRPMEAFKTPAKPSGLKPQGEAPDLFFIRQNLEMMTSMLEKAGDNLSPEMRAKLENEIKGLLNKVSIMVGSSSSS